MSKRGRPPHDDQLTPAEWRVVEAVRHGLSNPEIAALAKVEAARRYTTYSDVGNIGSMHIE